MILSGWFCIEGETSVSIHRTCLRVRFAFLSSRESEADDGRRGALPGAQANHFRSVCARLCLCVPRSGKGGKLAGKLISPNSPCPPTWGRAGCVIHLPDASLPLAGDQRPGRFSDGQQSLKAQAKGKPLRIRRRRDEEWPARMHFLLTTA